MLKYSILPTLDYKAGIGDFKLLEGHYSKPKTSGPESKKNTRSKFLKIIKIQIVGIYY